MSTHEENRLDVPDEERLTAAERVVQFRTFASAEAFQLAGLLAPTP